ncbi:sialate O-acetylesterase [Rubinisphaera margarita]|uniref:sialate O-acetylesterase n=1 Tax=Rubinisphaera margarita TaxID=2909586 RepID=UPI001EE85438|nr:sialate O-acetylesterase [Rubinisphaera margarita]MCG6158032.1 sialate O-acetylesterase [Rubinisphaera margarita]
MPNWFRIPLVSCFALLFAVSPAVAADKPTHLFILSGQSNMAGMKPDLGFVPELSEEFKEGETAYIKIAEGGKPIRFWLPDDWNMLAERYNLETKLTGAASEKNYYSRILDEYEKYTEKNGWPKRVTFCWMQGERDARERLSSAYADALKLLIANLRRDLKQPEMTFVIGRLSDFRPEPQRAHWEIVRQAQVQVAEDDPLGAWVDCDDLNNKKKGEITVNDLHYTQEGYELLGRRYVRQAKALVEGRKPADNGRPE